MTSTTRTAALCVALVTLALFPLAAGWGNDAAQEPSTPFDDPKYIWSEPNQEAVDKIYFNGFVDFRDVNNPNADFSGVDHHAGTSLSQYNGRLSPMPTARATALLGYWRDCNRDGYIGHRDSGMLNYPRSFGFDRTICPEGSDYAPDILLEGEVVDRWNGTYNGTQWFITRDESLNMTHPPQADEQQYVGFPVHELLPIGPDNSTANEIAWYGKNDTAARVWADITHPLQKAVLTKSITPLPYGTLDSWAGHLKYVDDLTFNQVSTAYEDAMFVTGADELGAPPTIYDTPGQDEYNDALWTVRDAYAQDNERYPNGTRVNGEGNPMFDPWKCGEDPEDDPTFEPSANPQGGLSESVNATIRGLIFHTPNTGVEDERIPGWYKNGTVRIGQGCDSGDGDPAFFNTGTSLTRAVFSFETLQYFSQGNAPVKDRTDFYFVYDVPQTEARNAYSPWDPAASLSAWGIWRMPINLLRPTTNPDELGYGVTKANWWTFYAKVDTLHPSLHPKNAFPGSTQDDDGIVQPPAFEYGEEACALQDAGYDNGWECDDKEAWKTAALDVPAWRVIIGETYQLRDTDCTDASPVAPKESTEARRSVDKEYVDAMNGLFDDPDTPGDDPRPGPKNVFVSYCDMGPEDDYFPPV